MAIDFNKPVTTDDHATVFVPGIRANLTAIAQMLDSGLVSIVGTPPTGVKKYNRTSSALEEWNGSAWVGIPLQGITYSANKIGVNVTPTAGLHVVAPASTTYAKWDAPTAAFGYHQFMQGGVAFGYLGQASGLITGGLGTDLAIRTQGNLIFGQSSNETVRMDTVGRVGIGTVPVNSAANATNLQIGNPLVAGGSGITIGATTTSDIAFADGVSGSSQFAGMIRYSHASDTMGLWTAGVQRVSIGPLGAVTIASLAAAPGLHVNGGDVTTGAAIQLIGVDRNWQIAQGGTRGGGAGGIAFYDTVSAATRLSISALGLVNAPVGFSGPGSGLTALNADNIASGTIANARTTGTAAATAGTLVLRDGAGAASMAALTIGSVLTLASDGRLFGTALHNNAGDVTGASNQYIASGTYTPTLTNTTNISSSVASACQWIRVGNVVTVSGQCSVSTSANAATVLGISLPIASAMTSNGQLAGTHAAATTGTESGSVVGDATNDRATMNYIADSAATKNRVFQFTYVIV